MKILLYAVLSILHTTLVPAQSVIRGTIHTNNGQAIFGSNIYLSESLEGTTSDQEGNFIIKTKLSGSVLLIVSHIGYESFSKYINLDKEDVYLSIILLKKKTQLDEVAITAGTFEASDKKKSVVLNTLDLSTNSNSMGDIYGSIRLLPGVSNTDQEGGLLVRGGELYETKTFIDGLAVDNPYTAKLPNVPVRGRFSPMLFKETTFSTGGYSAEFGQALSAALILNSLIFPEKNETGVSLHSAGVYLTATRKKENTAIISNTQYNDLNLYYMLAKSNIDWIDKPRGFSQTLVLRQRIGENGLLKTMGMLSIDKSSMNYFNPDSMNPDYVSLNNKNAFIQSNYITQFAYEWIMYIGASFGYDNEGMGIDKNAIENTACSSEIKLSFKKAFTSKIKINFGGNLNRRSYNMEYLSAIEDSLCIWNYNVSVVACYAETELTIIRRFAFRAGTRLETVLPLNKSDLSPRLSLAFKITQHAQLSAGYGYFYQIPQDKYLIFNQKLYQENARHYILNFQNIKNERVFRIEAYYKRYSRLVKYDSLYATEPESYTNDGHGYSQGIDLFFRDKKTIRNGDLWISYSFLDSRREYKDFPCSLQPLYVAKHSLSVLYKHYIENIDSYIGINYKFSSGLPYLNPNKENGVQDIAKPYHDVGINLFHFTKLFGQFTMLHLQVSNIFGFNTIYGYTYSKCPDENGNYEAFPILPASKRFFIVGIFISFTGQPEI